ncbi:MAG: lysylphosphatidylglycerol synthase transmembrane domain-containing protein [Gammaproteobacteria bacterium]
MSRKSLWLLLRLAVAAALTVLLVYYVSPSKIILVLHAANILLLLASIPLILLGMWLSALQLKTFTDCHGMDISLMRIMSINASTEFYNLFLPGMVSGGVIRWYRLSRDNRMRAQALAVIVMNRLLHIFFLLLLGVLGWLVEGNYAQTRLVAGFLAVCLLALTTSFLVFSNRRLSASVRGRLTDNAVRWPFIREKLRKLLDAASEYRQIPLSGRLQLIFYAISWHLVILSSTWVFCMALDIAVPFSAVAWIRAIITLATMMPLSISGFGIREGGWIYFLGLYGVAPADAFVLSLLTFVRSLFQAVIGFVIEIKTLFRGDNR